MKLISYWPYKRPKCLYLAGPMRGYPLFNFPEFDRYAQALRREGYEVISPAEIDRAEGFDPNNPPEITKEIKLKFLLRDIRAISQCDGIALMPGWGRSRGVAVEVAAAGFFDLRLFPINDPQRIAGEYYKRREIADEKMV